MKPNVMPSSKGKKDRLLRIKINKRYFSEKAKKCGECNLLFNGLCSKNGQVTYKNEYACNKYEQKTRA